MINRLLQGLNELTPQCISNSPIHHSKVFPISASATIIFHKNESISLTESHLYVHCSLSILCPKNFYPMGGCLSHRISRGAHAPRGNFQPRREQLVLLTFRWAILRCTLLASCSGLHGSEFPLTIEGTSITHPYTGFPFSFFSLDLYKCLWNICLILSRSISIYSIKCPEKNSDHF